MPEDEHQLMDWRVYADATCAGLSALIPIPFLDLVFELFFRRRMPGAIARARHVELDPRAPKLLGAKESDLLSARGCLILPVVAAKVVLKRIWRKLIYVFAIADAADQLSDYWHRAFLLDHVIRAGHAAPGVDVARTAATVDQVLEEVDTSGLRALARQVVAGVRHVPRLLRRARRGSAARETRAQEEILRAHWGEVEASLREVALCYNRVYVEPGEDPGVISESRQC
jgi:hypothetical protein